MKYIMSDQAKLKRAKDALGEDATVVEIFNEYNRIGGLIKDENYNKIDNWVEDKEVKESEVFEFEIVTKKKEKKVTVKKTTPKVKKTVSKAKKAEK